MSDLYVPPVDFTLEFVPGGVRAAERENKTKSREFMMVPLDKLQIVNGLNVRIHDAEYEQHVEFIKQSILENGFLPEHPLSGYAAKEGDSTLIYVTSGFTRLEATKRAVAAGAPIEALPVVLTPTGTSMLDLMARLELNNTGHPLKPYERAIVVKRMLGYGSTQDEIAQRLRLSGQYVKDLLYLMSLPKALQAIVIHGKASAKHVIDLARKVTPTEALKAFEASGATPEPESDGGGSDRVTPRDTAGAAAAAPSSRKPGIAKKTVFAAIDYAIALPGDGMKWLMAWRNGDAEAVKELDSYKPPRKTKAKAPAKAKAKKPAKAKAKGKKSDTPKDPAFDINGADNDAPL